MRLNSKTTKGSLSTLASVTLYEIFPCPPTVGSGKEKGGATSHTHDLQKIPFRYKNLLRVKVLDRGWNETWNGTVVHRTETQHYKAGVIDNFAQKH